MLTERPIPQSLLRRTPLVRHVLAPEASAATTSRLRKPDHHHPFTPFLVEDVAGIALAFAGGFDAMWRDGRGMTCAMACAERGLAQSLHLAFEGASDPGALALVRLDAGLDAFDLAAASGAVACMVEISRRLPRAHRSGIERGFMWHAVQSSTSRADLGQAWLVDLCAAPKNLFSGRDATEALAHARAINWTAGVSILAAHLGVPELLEPASPVPSTVV